MKISATVILVALTLFFAAFLGGFFLGRSSAGYRVEVSAYADPSASQSDTTDAADRPTGKININTATAEQLCTLDGISATLAQRIIDYRETFGPFKNLAQLTEVDGIGQKILDKIIDRITV